MSRSNHDSQSSFWRSSQSTQAPGIGEVRFQKVADATAEELNNYISQPTISYAGEPKQSIYDVYNEGTAVPDFDDSMGATNGIDVYRVGYTTHSPDTNKNYRVSGLLAVPKLASGRRVKNTSFPLVSYQHGTTLYPEDAPTNLFANDQVNLDATGTPYSPESLFNLVKLAGNGLAVSIADHIGNGHSKATQAFWVKDTVNQTNLDMIKASKATLEALGLEANSLLLSGWSQGGLQTEWLAQELKDRHIPIAAIAVASGPSDVAENLQYWANDYPGQPTWLTSAIPLPFAAYETYYGLDGLMRQAIRPEYLDLAWSIYNKTYDWSQGLPPLPTEPDKLLTDSIIGKINAGSGAFMDMITNNTALQGRYSAPSMFYGGDADTVVPPMFSTTLPVEHQLALGGNSSAMNMGETATHRSTYLASLYNLDSNVLDFFNAALAA